jgi:hypothetical protein
MLRSRSRRLVFEIHVGKACPLVSFTTKQLSSSSTDHGGGKRRFGPADGGSLTPCEPYHQMRLGEREGREELGAVKHVGGRDPQHVRSAGVPIRVPQMQARGAYRHQPPRRCHPMGLRALRAAHRRDLGTLRSENRTASPRRERDRQKESPRRDDRRTLGLRGGFSLRPGHADVVAPRKRPFHTIIPAFVTQSGRPVMSFGVMGGSIQPQAHTQVMVRLNGLPSKSPGGFGCTALAAWRPHGRPARARCAGCRN